MPENAARTIQALIDETTRIERESEVFYLSLGRLFPRLSEELGRSADNAERAIAGFGAAGARGSRGAGAEGGIGRGPSESGDSAKESSDYFRALQACDSTFLDRINESIGHLSSLEGLIARVRSDSEEMEIISLNAMTVALKSGAAGKAFSVITDELKRLSSQTISLTDEVTERGRSLLEQFGRMRNSLHELDEFQCEFFAGLQDTITKGYGEIERSAVDAASFFGDLLREARGVAAPVSRVMQEVQLQDIVRQSLQHVGLSLREALGEERGPDAELDPSSLPFVAAVAELSASLVDDIVEKLDASAGSFARDMDEVGRIVEDCERRRSAFLDSAGAVAVDAQGFGTRSRQYHELKHGVISGARRLSDYVHGLDDSFKALARLLSRFQTIVVASRIEVAKTRALAGVVTTVRGMIELTDRIALDVGEAMGTTKSFIGVASAAIGEYAASEGGEGDRLDRALELVAREVDRLSEAGRSVRGAIGAFALYTDRFIALAGESREALGGLRALSSRLVAVRAELDALLASARSGAGSADGGASPAENERLKKMVERFTIFTHKKAAGSIGRFDVEEGGVSGEVTLF